MERLVPINNLERHARSTDGIVRQAIERVLASGIYILGSEVIGFEAEFASYCGVRHAVATANGTDALEIALRANGIEPGMRVAVVANAGGYATTAIRSIGAIPVFVDVDPDTHLMSLDQLAVQSASGLQAAVVTHLYGRLHEMQQVMFMANRGGFSVIEDCAQAHGAVGNGGRAGSFGHAGCFSFYPTKNLGSLGDAGIIVTNNSDLAQRASQLRQYGWKSKYKIILNGGRNSRMDELQAAILRNKLPLLDMWNARRRAVAEYYTQNIKNTKIKALPTCGYNYVAHLYVVCSEDRDALQLHLARRGIGSDIHYPVPDHLQLPWHESRSTLQLPVTELLARHVLTLPCFPELEQDEVNLVIEALNSW